MLKKSCLAGQLACTLLLLGCTVANPRPPPEPVANALPLQQTRTAGDSRYPDQEFLKTASIYEVNVRQFSEAGTFAEVSRQIPRLQSLGVDILWLMPVQPIGEKNRKGDLGSYYAIQDYTAAHADYGSVEDVATLVKTAHAHGQIVILDWVANHTAWDHEWIETHPDWYTRTKSGDITDPIDPATGKSWGWTDVADLNYASKGLWAAMVAEMKFWIETADVDGFRCDVAGEVPADFWRYARGELNRVKPVFMLAEAEQPGLERSFDMSYGWEFHHLTNQVARGEKPAGVFDEYMRNRREKFPRDHLLMMFTTNHDENSWNGSVFERYGDAHQAFAVLASTLDGMPLIYSGQEAGMDRRLEFFTKDAIDWNDYALRDFYAALMTLKADTPALWNGTHGGEFRALDYRSNSAKAYAFQRVSAASSVAVAINFSGDKVVLDFATLRPAHLTPIFGEAVLGAGRIDLDAYGFVVLTVP